MKEQHERKKEVFTNDLLVVEGINCLGYGIIPKYVMIDPDLPIEAKTIYAYFSSLAGNGKTAFPSRGKILKDLKISKNFYYKNFNLLLKAGYITVKRIAHFPYNNVYILVSNPKNFQKYIEENTDTSNYSRIKSEGIKSKGFGFIARAAMFDTRLDIKAKGIYSYFCSFAGNEDAAFPKVETILSHLMIGRQAYYKYLKQLTTYKYIIVKQRKINNRKFSVNDYYISEFPDLELNTKEISVFSPNETQEENTNIGAKAGVSRGLSCADTRDIEARDNGSRDIEARDNGSGDIEARDNHRKDININRSNINNNNNIYLSIKKSKNTVRNDRLIESLDLKLAQIKKYNYHNYETLEAAIKFLWENGIKGTDIKKVRNDILSIDINILDLANRKFSKEIEEKEIKYPLKYFASCIYNAITESNLYKQFST